MASEYEIRNEDGQLFCKCQTGDGDVRLVTKNCSISMREFILKVHEPIHGHRGKMRRHKEIKDRIF